MSNDHELRQARWANYKDELAHALKSIVWTTDDELSRELEKLIEKQKSREEATFVTASVVAWLMREASRPSFIGEERARAMDTAAFSLCGRLSYFAHERRDAREMKRIAAPVRKEK